MRRRHLALAVWITFASAAPALLGSSPALAQAPEEIAIARQTAVEGLAAYKAGEFDKALKLFEQARALYPSAQILRMHGYSLLALREWEKAAEAMEASLASTTGALGDADRKDVQEQLGKALAHLGQLMVTTHASDAELVVDAAEPLPLPMNKPLRLLEGKYHIALRTPDHPEVARDIDLEGGKKIELTLDPTQPDTPVVAPEPKPTPAPKPVAPDSSRAGWFPGQRTVGFVAVGTGVALGAAALITAVAGAGLRSQVADDVTTHEDNFGKNCDRGDPRLCRFDRQVINHDADRADRTRDASVWMGIGAGVLAAGGVVLIVFSPRGASATTEQQHARGGGGRLACGPLASPGIACQGRF